MKKWILALAVVALASFGASAQTVSLSSTMTETMALSYLLRSLTR